MTSQLASQHCAPCAGDVPALEGEELEALFHQLDADWNLVEQHHLEKDFSFDSYLDAIDFVNTVSHIALEQDHHPDIYFTFGNVKITLWTHKIGGLSVNDFVMAARVEEAYKAAPLSAQI